MTESAAGASRHIRIPADVVTASRHPSWRENFRWPVSPLELPALRRRIEETLQSALAAEPDSRLRSVLIATYCRLVVEHLSLLHALLVVERFSQQATDLDASAQRPWNRIFGNLVSSREPVPMQLPALAPPMGAIKRARRAAKSMRQRLANLRPYGRHVPRLLFKHAPIAVEIAALRAIPVRQVDEAALFSRRSQGPSRALPGVSRLADEMTERIRTVFRDAGAPCPTEITGHLRVYHQEIFGRAYSFLCDAEVAVRRLRGEVWAGSGQNLLVRLAAEARRAQGERTVCFEHGESKALYDSSVNSYAELGCCDAFVTYTERCADLYRRQLAAIPNLHGESPDIDVSPVGIGELTSSFIPPTTSVRAPIGTRRVLYVAGGFNNDLIYYAWRPHDMIYAEWQAWLLDRVREMGYPVAAKFHPEGLLHGSAPFVIRDVELLAGLFEEHAQRDDVLLFDTTCSTALQTALCTPNPIVLVHYPASELHADVKKAICGRVELVEGFVDERNRIRVSADDLNSALDQCASNKDFDFVREYLVEF